MQRVPVSTGGEPLYAISAPRATVQLPVTVRQQPRVTVQQQQPLANTRPPGPLGAAVRRGPPTRVRARARPREGPQGYPTSQVGVPGAALQPRAPGGRPLLAVRGAGTGQ